jgi:uroporphyrin-3 C-methyltransferase
MSDREDNSPGYRDTKAAYRNEKKEKRKAGSSAEAAFNKTDAAAAARQTNSKPLEPGKPAPETATTIPHVESAMESSAEKDTSSRETPSSAEAAFNKIDTAAARQTTKSPEPEKPKAETATTIPHAESRVDSSAKKDTSSRETPQTRRTKPVFDPPPRGTPPPPGRGKFFVWFAALAIALILVAVGEAYYAYSLAKKEQAARETLSKKLAEQLDTQINSRVVSQVEEHLSQREGPLRQTVTNLNDEIDNLKNELDKYAGGLKREGPLRQTVTNLKNEFDKYAGGLKMVQKEVAALESSLRTLRTETKGNPNAEVWDIAEATYLLRIAYERLRLEQDIGTALVALQLADRVLHKATDPALTPVRSKLAEEINSLKTVPIPDIDGMALSLSSLIERVKELEVKETVLEKEPIPAAASKGQTPDQAPETKDDAYVAKAKEFLHVIWEDFENLIVVKHRDKGEGGIPILLPKERYFLYQNLRFELEAARLSLLRKNQDSFQQSLKQAQSWLQNYFQGPEAKAMKDTLAKLERTVIEPPLPNISESLRILNRVRENMGPQAARDEKGGRA